MSEFIDWLGQEVKVGDTILYPAGVGSHAAAMVLAEVLEFKIVYHKWSDIKGVLKIAVRPLKATRWKDHNGRVRYIDTRTGKGIDPWAGDGKHIAKRGHYRNKITGEESPARGSNWQDWDYVSPQFRDYVQLRKTATERVWLTITENVTKVARPDDL